MPVQKWVNLKSMFDKIGKMILKVKSEEADIECSMTVNGDLKVAMTSPF